MPDHHRPGGRPLAHACGRPPPRTQRTPRPPGTTPRHGPAYTPGDDRGPPGSGTLRLNLAALTGTTGTAGGNPGSGQDLVFALEPLAGPCDHRHQAAGHDPGSRCGT